MRDNRIAPIDIFRQRCVHCARKLTNLATFDIHFVFGAGNSDGVFSWHIWDLTRFSSDDECIGGDCIAIGRDDHWIDVERFELVGMLDGVSCYGLYGL